LSNTTQHNTTQHNTTQHNTKHRIEAVLKADERLWNADKTELNQTLLFDYLERIDETLIAGLLQDEVLRSKFFVPIKDVFVFKMNDFRFFMEENKINNSYTTYKNRIGLGDGKRLLKNSQEVVLHFPYKDCVLEGGQSTEEGQDKAVVFDSKTGEYRTENKKRNEVFFNQILAKDEIDRLFDAKALTHWQRHTATGGEAVANLRRRADGTIQENLIIKGNNLLALHSLKQQFTGKVKLIYIDPPYNTGNDGFKYNDRFNHSTWLTFMKNRLEVARDLLRDDGVIFVQIDNKELHYVKILMDEIFGVDKFVSDIAVRSSTPSGLKTAHKDKTIIKQRDSVLFFKKNIISLKPQYTKKDKWDTHYSYLFDKESNSALKLIDVLIEKNILNKNQKLEDFDINNKKHNEFYINYQHYIYRTAPEMPKEYKKQSIDNPSEIIKYLGKDGEYQYAKNGNRFSFLSKSIKKVYKNQKIEDDLAILLCDFWSDIDFQNTQNEGDISFPSGKKPELLLHRIIDMTTNHNDIVLDFHLGSGTTAAVAHKMGRQYIGIEQMDYIETIAVERLKKVVAGEQGGISKAVNWQGGGDFIYVELAKWNESAKEALLAADSLPALEALFEQMTADYFLNYNLNIKVFQAQVLKEEGFRALTLDEQKRFFIEMLDNNQLYVQATEMADKKFGISAEDQALTKAFYEGGN
jgi:adenine-specific DNA-methyltransferase